jgi:hypothetical protein
VRLGNGDGTFRTTGKYGTFQTCPDLVVGDFDGGELDFAAVLGGDSAVYTFPGNGDGTFRQGATYDLPGAFSPVVADFNGDETWIWQLIPLVTTACRFYSATAMGCFRALGPLCKDNRRKEHWAAANACLSWSMISTAMGSWMWRIVLLDLGRSELY